MSPLLSFSGTVTMMTFIPEVTNSKAHGVRRQGQRHVGGGRQQPGPPARRRRRPLGLVGCHLHSLCSIQGPTAQTLFYRLRAADGSNAPDFRLPAKSDAYIHSSGGKVQITEGKCNKYTDPKKVIFCISHSVASDS